MVRHPLGTTKVPPAPRRIVSLTNAATDSLVALGVRPVLVESAWKSNGVAPYLAAGLEGVPALRRVGTINLEAVLEAKPDLILAGTTQDGRLYGPLSKIAPTVCLGGGTAPNREMAILEVAAALGMSQRANRRLAEYHQFLARAKRELAGIAPQPVIFLRFRQRTCVVYTRTSMFGPLLFDDLGLTPDAAMPQGMAPGGWDVLSVERLSTLRARRIFMVVDTDSETYLADVAETPIWRQIPAVRDGRVYRVAASHVARRRGHPGQRGHRA